MLQLCRKKLEPVKSVRFSLAISVKSSLEEDIFNNRRFDTDTCLSSTIFQFMRRRILLERLIHNSDVLSVSLLIRINGSASPKVTDTERLSRETQTEDVSSDTAVREELREQLDAKVSRETQTEDESSDAAAREDLHEQLDVKGLVSLGQNLKDLYLEERNYDVTITVRNRTFKAHRAVLEARAPVLADIRSHRMTEGSDETICVMDCEPNAFAVFLLFVYSGTVENLSGENVADVFFVADKYALPELKEKCVRYMLDSLATGSICNIIALASRLGERELLERATEFFIQNAQDILPTVQWRRFMVEHPDQANELTIKSLAFCARER